MLLSFRATADAIQERRTGNDLALVLPIRTRTAVALRAAPQPGSLQISTGITVSLEAADPIGTSLPIRVGSLLVQASGTGFRPIRTGVRVTLRGASLPGTLPIETGIDVAFTIAERGFAFNRDLVIAGQSDLPATTLTDVVLLGINFTDPDFRSLENDGQLALSNAEDIQFISLINGVTLVHNIVSHNPVTGQLIFDLKLPLWQTNQNMPVRMLFGAVGQVPSRLNIATSGLEVELTPAEQEDFPFLPENPITKRASYTGNTYYVTTTATGVGAPNNPNSPGGFKATIQGINDTSRIIVRPGNYPGFDATPKSGQTGRIQILAENPVFTDLNLSFGGGMIGYDRTESHSVITGQINFIGFDDLWFEGFRLGPADERLSNTDTTSGKLRVYGTAAVDHFNWIVKNYFKNNIVIAALYGDAQYAVHYRNYHLGNRRIPNENWAGDYFVFMDDNGLKKMYVTENYFHGGFNQGVSLKQEVEKAWIRGNTFDQSIVIDGTSGGTAIIAGQVPDVINSDVTCGYCLVSHNKFRGCAGLVIENPSNIVEYISEFNEFTHTGVGAAVTLLNADVRDDKNTDGDTMFGPKHPSTWSWRNNTVNGSASSWRWNRGRVYVNGCTLSLSGNTVPSGGITGISVPDGGLEGPHGPDFKATAAPTVSYGSGAGLNPP